MVNVPPSFVNAIAFSHEDVLAAFKLFNIYGKRSSFIRKRYAFTHEDVLAASKLIDIYGKRSSFIRKRYAFTHEDVLAASQLVRIKKAELLR